MTKPSLSATTKFYIRHKLLVEWITWVVRIAIGALFIFSGFVKGIDVWGTIYKFGEYWGALGVQTWDILNVVGVFLLCLLEFLIGVFLIFGCFRYSSPVLAAIVMAFMLPLTFWLAVAEPISDCGCFGDALILTNWQTFWKNVGISIGVIWLIFYNKRLPCLINPYLQWIAAVGSGTYLLTIALLGYYYQPLIDFRPYKIGTPLTEEATSGYDDNTDRYMVFIYEKNGVKKEFGVDDLLPEEDEGWNFIGRRYRDMPDGFPELAHTVPESISEKNFSLFDADGLEEETEYIVGEGRQLILMIPDLNAVPAAKTWKINSLYDWCKTNDIEMFAAVGASPEDIIEWKDISLADYPIYISDDTSIKEVVRGNPAVVYLEDGIIKWKSSLGAINIDDFLDKGVGSDPMALAYDNNHILLTITCIYAGVMGALLLLSLFGHLAFKPKHANDHKFHEKE